MLDLNSNNINEYPLATVKEILKMLTDYQIYQYYLDDELILANAMCSPLRKDDIPSFSFYKTSLGKIIWKDFATGETGDCFDFVKTKFNLTFSQTVIKITKDFNLPLYYTPDASIPILRRASIPQHKLLSMPNKGKLGVKVQPFTKADRDYWSSYGISSNMLKQYNIYSCKLIFLGSSIISVYTSKNPIYAYLFYKDSEYTWKIYKPLEVNRRFKWMSNTNKSILQGWAQMPKNGQILIINKSLKDVMVAKTLGFDGISMQSESQMIKSVVIEELKRRFKYIFILQDFDLAGVKNANKHYKQYGLIPIFLQWWGERGNGLKDISDWVQKMGKEVSQKKLNDLINNKINIINENS